MSQTLPFSKEAIHIDPTQEVERIVSLLKQSVRMEMRRYGGVVGVSGGVDSSVVLAICVRAFGPEHVAAIIMPEKESDPESEKLALHVAKHFGVEPIVEDITPAAEGFDCYGRRDEAIKRMVPEFDANVGYAVKIVLPGDLLESEILNVFMLTVVDPQGCETSHRIPVTEFRQIVAASNFKQRTRMAFLYYHAELNHYAVIGTANKDEHDLGFFVKHGDGGVDVQPIAHLYKTQVYQLAEELEIPDVIRARVPSTDTYSAGGTQQEF
ncbi:MAG: NAD(+) synthase, partial [Chloroflexi bacterium]|nr:NAD(+) synthase [Chloroflexota bacterium]